MQKRGYALGHFHLSPTQVNVPNDRPRYYCLAVLLHFTFGNDLTNSISMEYPSTRSIMHHVEDKEDDSLVHFVQHILYVANQHFPSPPTINTSILELGVQEATSDNIVLPPIREFLDSDIPPLCNTSAHCVAKQKLESLRIPPKLLQSSASWCFDIVSVNEKRPTACFTHSYGKFIRGTGSILYMGSSNCKNDNESNTVANGRRNEARSADPATTTEEQHDELHQQHQKRQRFDLVNPRDRIYDEGWANDISVHNLRYFSGSEIGRFMGFPMSRDSNADTLESKDDAHDKHVAFRFPSTCSIKSQWKLLGNSLNVRVAARVAELGLDLLLANAGYDACFCSEHE